MALKLVYFDIRGLAEQIRLLLTDQEVPFTDVRVSRDEWATLKPKMTFGQIPCLEVGDESFVQTGAIIRHLARVHGLYGSTETEATFIDVVFEGIRDIHSKYVQVIYGDYEGQKDNFIANVLPEQLKNLEKIFQTYQNGEHYVVGEKVSFADYALFEELDILLVLSPTSLDATPLLKNFHQRFSQRPNLVAYLNKRAALNKPINGNGKQ